MLSLFECTERCCGKTKKDGQTCKKWERPRPTWILEKTAGSRKTDRSIPINAQNCRKLMVPMATPSWEASLRMQPSQTQSQQARARGVEEEAKETLKAVGTLNTTLKLNPKTLKP